MAPSLSLLDLLDMQTDPLSRLLRAHPAIFRGNSLGADSHLPEGWYEVAHQLCSGIERTLGDDIGRFMVWRIHERDGRLAIDYWIEDHQRGPVDIESGPNHARVIQRGTGSPSVLVDELIAAVQLKVRSVAQTR